MGLSNKEIDRIANAISVKQAKLKKKEDKEQRDWRLHNTQLLLSKYRFLKAHCNDIPSEIEELELNTTIFDIRALTIESLIEHKAKSIKMLRYFDGVLNTYEQLCRASPEACKRRFKVIKRLYLDERVTTRKALEKELHIDKSTVSRDVKTAVDELSIMLFGIDAIL